MEHAKALESWERPEWVRQLSYFLNHGLVDFLADDGSDDDPYDQVLTAAMAAVCDHYGHAVEQDQCNNPEHRFCLWCHRGFPNVPVGNYKERVSVNQ